MKFSLISSTIIGASIVLAAPVAQQDNVITIVEQVTSVVPVTTVVGQDASRTAAADGPNITANLVDVVLLDENGNPIQNSTNTGVSSQDANSPGGAVNGNYFPLGASNTVTGPGNPNQIGGSPGNAGAFLGTGTNDFGTSVYDYSGYPGGFDRQPGQSEDGSYGPDSGPAEGSIAVSTGTANAPGASGTGSPQPPVSTSQFFRLVANVTGNEDPQGINGYYVGTYHVSAASSIAHLTNSTGRGGNGTLPVGRVFRTNGTDSEVGSRQGTTVTSGGTSPFPESIVLTDGLETTNVGASNLANVFINAGVGTQGVEVEKNDNGVYVLSGAGDAGFYACFNENVPYNSTSTLKYLVEGEEVPDECESIVLLPECIDGDGNPYTTGSANEAQQNPVGCYISVADIDWSQYPSSY